MLLVQKYGGSSVADLERLRLVARRIVDAARPGNRVVVVVSAMGRTTDELLALARAISPRPPRRELDMLLTTGERISMALLAMAVSELGVPAVSLTGSQSGIITNDQHTEAAILEVRPKRIVEHLASQCVVIVAGYQGVSKNREITTLGRGGSDTTAIALSHALGADRTEICSDVDGIYSADPSVVPDARRLDALGWDDLVTLSRGGARVIAPSAAEWAQKHQVEFFACATRSNQGGTRVGAKAPPAVGIAAQPDGTITALGLAEHAVRRAVAAPIFDLRATSRATVVRVDPQHLVQTQRALHELLQ